ncbi:MAG: D-alanyl-D-alanine carboxypeptidase/D-alanyl-D-alanine-endopeptidase [Gaiellaceae bacterium]
MSRGARIRLLALVCSLLLAFAGASASQAAQRSPLAKRLASALSTSGAAWERSGALVVDLTTARTIYAQNPWASLVPASNEKLAVTYAALSILGPSYRIETTVLGHGRLLGSTWRGDLFLRGRGDPSLDSAALGELARQLSEAGVTAVSGGVVGDETYFDSRRTAYGWKPEFYVNESPPISALSVNRTTAAEPALGTTIAFREALRAAGVRVAGAPRLGRTPPGAWPLASVLSPPMRDLVRAMDTDSDNYTAELLIKQLGAVVARRGTTPAGAAVVTGALKAAGIPLRGVRIVDGSGLSRLDRLTPGAIVGLLRAAFADPLVRPSFVAALPVAGRTGTLASRLRGTAARGRVAAKTGTTNLASALSGFVSSRYAFAILQNGNPVAHSEARASQDRFVAILAAQ